MGKYQAYPAYKDSGVEWLGEIPSGWQAIPVGRLFWRIKRTNHQEKELLSVYRDYGVIPTSSRDDNNNKPSEDLSPYQLVMPDDLVMNKMKAWQGSIAISEFEGIVSPAYFVYQPNKKMYELALPKYVHYLLRNPMYIAQYMRQSKGIRVNQWDLDPEEFQRIELLLPSKDEQQKIAAFLDHETAKIDALIEKQQQLIQLLKEKRQAVISHAVTKGLNPNAPMKDSGIEWLGEVPAHWEIGQIGYYAFVTKLTGFEYTNHWETKEDGEIIALRGLNIKNGFLIFDNIERIERKLSNTLWRSKLNAGDIVFPCTGTLGNAAIIEEDGKFHINQNVAKIRFDNSFYPQFVLLWLLSNHIKMILEKNNSSAMQPVILIGDLRKLPIPRIPMREQIETVTEVGAKLKKLDSILVKTEMSLSLIQERRTALISAAVTGKIDVRDFVVPA